MGGHGALTIGLRGQDRFRSVSAFSPIVAPSQCPWGEKALGNYLGDDREEWHAYDACALLDQGLRVPDLLVDQGEADDFLTEQLKTELLVEACERTGKRRRSGCSPDMTTAIISSRPSWPSMSPGMRKIGRAHV